MKMTPTIIVLGALLCLTGGFSAGAVWQGKRSEDSETAAQIAEITASVAANTEAFGEAAAALQQPITIDAETRAELAGSDPAGCLDASESLSPACLAARCWRYQQSDAGRSDATSCAALVSDARLAFWIDQCGAQDDQIDWSCVEKVSQSVQRF